MNDSPIGIAIVAMGGQGGGVLADWIVSMAEAAGWIAQSTSVPGVAQRTGATIYYVELIAPRAGQRPVLSLMPVPGAVDVVIAAELMEAGRAIQRGLVSPDRTVLIASTHRSFAVTEKSAPGDGIADPAAVLDAANGVSLRFVGADMQALAERAGSVISASLFGALAGSGALPFARPAFEATVRAAGVGVEASLRAFAAGFDLVVAPALTLPEPPAPGLRVRGGTAEQRQALAEGLARIDAMPAACRAMLRAGFARAVDYQDAAYGGEYLDRVAALHALDDEPPGFALTTEAARQVAVAMCYDDVIRVADLKTRASRFDRVRSEVGLRPDQGIGVTEFMHPRVDELCAIMPAGIGAWMARSASARRVLKLLFERGRRVRTTSLTGFLPLYAVAGLRRWRRSLLRHRRERSHLDAWLGLVTRHVGSDYDLAVELLRCRRLVKGYSDTHARGESKFARVVGALPLLEHRPDAAAWIRRLRDAALADEAGAALDGALSTIRSFAKESIT